MYKMINSFVSLIGNIIGLFKKERVINDIFSKPTQNTVISKW